MKNFHKKVTYATCAVSLVLAVGCTLAFVGSPPTQGGPTPVTPGQSPAVFENSLMNEDMNNGMNEEMQESLPSCDSVDMNSTMPDETNGDNGDMDDQAIVMVGYEELGINKHPDEELIAMADCPIYELNRPQPEMMQPRSQSEVKQKKERMGLYIEGDWLYWKGDEDGLDFGVHETSDISSTETPAQNYKDTDLVLNGNWNSGARASLGYFFGNKKSLLNVDLTWTYNRANAQSHHGDPSGSLDQNNYYRSAWFPYVMGPAATSASARWGLTYNVGDLSFGKEFHLNRKIKMLPYFGVRGAWIRQRYKANYNGIWTNIGAAGLDFIPMSTSLKFNSTFQGYGLRVGDEVSWHFNDNWSIEGDLSVSLLYSRFNIHEHVNGATYSLASLESSSTPISLVPQNFLYKKGMNQIRANIEAFAGLQWETWFSNDDYRVAFAAGYEMSYWFAQNEFFASAGSINGSILNRTNIPAFAYDSTFLEVRQHGDLSFQGVTIKAMFDF